MRLLLVGKDSKGYEKLVVRVVRKIWVFPIAQKKGGSAGLQIPHITIKLAGVWHHAVFYFDADWHPVAAVLAEEFFLFFNQLIPQSAPVAFAGGNAVKVKDSAQINFHVLEDVGAALSFFLCWGTFPPRRVLLYDFFNCKLEQLAIGHFSIFRVPFLRVRETWVLVRHKVFLDRAVVTLECW
jgi:hypothetical protein